MAVCKVYSTLLLIVQGLEDCLMQGNCDEGELLWRAEATAGSCASLPGPVDVCAGGIGVGQKTDMCMPTAPLTAVLMQSGV